VSGLAGIGKSGRVKLSRLLESNPRVITSAIVSDLLSMPLKESSRTLSRWCRSGWLYRIKRGVYIPVPIDSTSGKIILEEPFIIAESIYQPGYVAHSGVSSLVCT